jgi:hypothetical protein
MYVGRNRSPGGNLRCQRESPFLSHEEWVLPGIEPMTSEVTGSDVNFEHMPSVYRLNVIKGDIMVTGTNKIIVSSCTGATATNRMESRRIVWKSFVVSFHLKLKTLFLFGAFYTGKKCTTIYFMIMVFTYVVGDFLKWKLIFISSNSDHPFRSYGHFSEAKSSLFCEIRFLKLFNSLPLGELFFVFLHVWLCSQPWHDWLLSYFNDLVVLRNETYITLIFSVDGWKMRCTPTPPPHTLAT